MLMGLALVFLFGMGFGYVFKRLKLPSLLGMLLAGVLIGPFGLNWIDPSLLAISPALRQIALVIILMRAGLGLDIAALKKVGRPAFFMCFLPACFEIAAFMWLAPKWLGVTTLEAALMGAVVAAVSPAVIVPNMLKLIDEKWGTNKSVPQLIMAGASVDDAFVIVVFTTLLGVLSGGQMSMNTVFQVPVIIGLVEAIAAGYILLWIFKVVHMRDSVKTIVLLSVSMVFAWASSFLAIIGLGATILHQNKKLAKRLSDKFAKLWVGAEVLLFVLVGATVDVAYATSGGLVVVLLLACALVVRMVGVWVCLVGTPYNPKEKLFCMIAYIPKATVQAAIGGIPLAMGLPCGKLVLTVAVLSIIVTAPLGAVGINATYKRLLHQDSSYDSDSETDSHVS